MEPDCTMAFRAPGGRRVAALAAVLVLSAASLQSGCDSVRAQGGQALAQFTSGVDLVEVYATVSDRTGEPVTGLQASDFRVSEDGRAQVISTFAAGTFPLTVALGIDRSLSMAGEPLRIARRASTSFLRALGAGDRSMVLAIGSTAEVVAPLSADRDSQIRAVGSLDAWSTTALHDAIVAGLDRLAPEPGRQALVLFSDGVDRYSRAGADDVLARARRTAALVYPIVIGRRPPLLPELAVLTGGRSFELRDARALDATLTRIVRELHHQYLLGYAPAAPGNGEPGWRAIRVELREPRPGVRIRARDGYVR